jgi:serine/threonine protein kinase
MNSPNNPESTNCFSPQLAPTLTRLVSAPDQHAASRQPDWPSGYTVLDEFLVERVLGRGGMGTVYAVRHLPTQQQFAAKRAHLTTEAARIAFLAELQTWIDLPEHPHLTNCRFFRTLGEDVLLFTDLADGGSLADQIGPALQKDIARILDIAIQAAWGLHAVHQLGIVHQDVKPGNLLLWSDGTLRVTDFGIARARAGIASQSSAANPPGQVERAAATDDHRLTTLYTAGAMTPAYCSPEQFARTSVSRRTDIWSWGITVLEMFAGRPLTLERGGQSADEIFRTMSHNGSLPGDVAVVLARCFQRRPADRWANLAEVAEELVALYGARLGRPYPRAWPEPPRRQHPPFTLECPVNRNVPWDLPRQWLSLAYTAAGRDPTEVETLLPAYSGTLRAQMVADLNAYTQAQRMLEECVATNSSLLVDLATLCGQRAHIHHKLADMRGALSSAETAIRYWEQVVQTDPQKQPEHVASLMAAYRFHAQLLRQSGEFESACRRYEQSIELARSHQHANAPAVQSERANALIGQGLTLRLLERHHEASRLIDDAIDRLQRLIGQIPTLANDLARAYLAKAREFSNRAEYDQAAALCDQAIALLRQATPQPGQPDLRPELARAIEQRADVARKANPKGGEALALCDEAIGIWERLVNGEGRPELMHDLARSYQGKAKALVLQHRFLEAVRLCEQATAIHYRLVHIEGRIDLHNELAWSLFHWANTLYHAGQLDVASQRCDQAIELWQRLIGQEQRSELFPGSARVYYLKAKLVQLANRPREALDWINQAIEVWRAVLANHDKHASITALLHARLTRAECLSALDQVQHAYNEVSEILLECQKHSQQFAPEDLRSLLAQAEQLQTQLAGRLPPD